MKTEKTYIQEFWHIGTEKNDVKYDFESICKIYLLRTPASFPKTKLNPKRINQKLKKNKMSVENKTSGKDIYLNDDFF